MSRQLTAEDFGAMSLEPPGATTSPPPNPTQPPLPIDFGSLSLEPPEPITDGNSDRARLNPISAFTKGMWTSMTSGNVEMLGAAMEALAVASGSEADATIGRDIQAWIRSKADKSDTPMDWDKAMGQEGFQFGDIAGFASWITALTGSAVGSMVAPIAAGAAGGALGGAAGTVVPGVGNVAGASVGAFTGAFSAGAILNIGETYAQLIAEKVDPKTAATAALTVGTGIGVLDTLALGKVLKLTGANEIKNKAVSSFVRDVTASYAKGAAGEGITEMAQSAIREATAEILSDDPDGPDAQERIMSILHEGLAGALGGGFIAGAGRAGQRILPGSESDPGATPPAEPTPDDFGEMATEPPTPEPAPAPAPAPEPAPRTPTVPSTPVEPTPEVVPAPVEPTPVEPTPEVVPTPVEPTPDDFGAMTTEPPAPAPEPQSPVAGEGPLLDPAPPPAGGPSPAPSSIEGVTGNEAILDTPDKEYKVRYRIVDVQKMQPSHNAQTFAKNEVYPEGVQERMYHSSRAAQADVIAKSQKVKPWQLVNTDATAIGGPPQATPSGIVLGGNGRMMIMQRAYTQGTAEGYRQYLIEHAEQFGMTAEQVRSIENPGLVREIEGAPTDIEGLRTLGRDLNKDFKKALSEVEEAVSAGKSISVESAESISLHFDEKNTLRQIMAKQPAVFRDALLKDGVLSETDLPKYFTSDGALNQAGKNFVENALLGASIGDADLLQTLQSSASTVAKLERIIPQTIELNNRDDAWNIMPDVKEAARQVVAAQIRGVPIGDQLGQGGLFGGGPSSEIQAIARVLAKKPLEVSAIFRKFAGEARQDVKGQPSMFGPADPNEAFARIFEMDPAQASEGKPDEGSYPFEGQAPKRREPVTPKAAKLDTPPALVRRSEIIARLSEALGGLPIRIGRIRGSKRVRGRYFTKAEVVRLRKANDIQTIMHEAGHHLNKLLYGGKGGKLETKELKPFADEFGKIATKGDVLAEGFAEYVRMYLTEPDAAMDAAPKFTKSFTEKLAEFPDIRDVLLGTRQDIRRYLEQPATAKILSHISAEDAPVRKGWWSSFYTNILDSLNPLQEVVKAMEKKSGNKLATEKNAYEVARLFAGWTGKADHFLTMGTFDAKTLERTGESLKDILKPIEGKLDDLRVYLVARRVVEKTGQGMETGIDITDAKTAIAELETPELKKAAERLYAYQDEVLNYLRDSDYLSDEQYELIKKMNENYVPFYRIQDEAGGGRKGGSGKSMADLWNPLKRMKGSTREIIDPLESIVKNTFTFINLAERNNIGLRLAAQAESTEGGGRWVEPVPPNMKPQSFSIDMIKGALKSAGMETDSIVNEDMEAVATLFSPDKSPSPGENIISVFKQGESKLYQVDPDLYRALKTLDQESANIIITILSKPAKVLRLGATGVSPEFLSRNIIRDAETAYIQSRNGFIPGVDTFRGLFAVLKKGELYEEAIRAGVIGAALASMDRKTLKSNLDDMMASPMQYVVRHPVEAARWFSEQLEMATRLGEYRKARKRGKSPRESALDAREVTLDFAVMGASTQSVNKIVAFFSATLNGTKKMLQTFKENPKGATIRSLVGITLPSIMLYAINRDDEEYKELPRWQKDFFWMIPTKGTPIASKTSFIPVPKPFLFGVVFGSSVERIMEWVDTQDSTAFDGLVNSAWQAAAPGFVPTAALPVIEMWANKSMFTGRSLVPGYLERLPEEHQYEPWTSEFSKGMAGMFGDAGLPISPIKIENAIFGYTAGAGRAVVQTIDPLLGQDGPEKTSKTWADIPGLRAFAVRKTGSTQSMQQFYDRIDKLSKKDAAWQFSKRYPGRIDDARLTPVERKEYTYLKARQRRMSNLSSQIRKVESSDRTGDEKRDRIQQIHNIRKKLAADTMARVRKFRK